MTIEYRHSRHAVICDPEALEGKLLPPMNEYKEADQAEWKDQAEYLRKLPHHTHPMVLDEADPFEAFTVGCVVVAVILAVFWLIYQLTK